MVGSTATIGDGFGYLYFQPLLGVDWTSDSYFSSGLKTPTRIVVFFSEMHETQLGFHLVSFGVLFRGAPAPGLMELS